MINLFHINLIFISFLIIQPRLRQNGEFYGIQINRQRKLVSVSSIFLSLSALPDDRAVGNLRTRHFRSCARIFLRVCAAVLLRFHHVVDRKKDTNLVKTELAKENLAKGFLSAGILAVILFILVLIPSFFSQGNTGTAAVVFNVIKFFLSMSVNYLVVFFFGASSPYGTVIMFGIVMLICTVSAGIGYIVGYKNIPLIEPTIQKIKKMWKN